ncbi:hypothetical protein R1sor_010697 [Riccia sorocarpa]|uniref:Myb/SANT-like domain-containing protein n=1 Tax=Riccia sorocarpa TaxID=122646 RepID=A0ABD3I070_9MARC
MDRVEGDEPDSENDGGANGDGGRGRKWRNWEMLEAKRDESLWQDQLLHPEMADKRIWLDEEIIVLIRTVKASWSDAIKHPRTLRIWDTIAENMGATGITCSSIQAKVK